MLKDPTWLMALAIGLNTALAVAGAALGWRAYYLAKDNMRRLEDALDPIRPIDAPRRSLDAELL